jgi:hypothetical protein
MSNLIIDAGIVKIEPREKSFILLMPVTFWSEKSEMGICGGGGNTVGDIKLRNEYIITMKKIKNSKKFMNFILLLPLRIRIPYKGILL